MVRKLVKKKGNMEEDEFDCEYTSSPICPHCGYKHPDSFEWDNEGDRACDSCGKEFDFERIVEVTWVTSKTDPSSR